MIERAAIRFTPDDWYYMEIDKEDVTCSVTGFMDGVPVDFFGDVEEGMMYLGELEWNQLQVNDHSKTGSGITFTYEDEELSVSGTATANIWWCVPENITWTWFKDHIYLIDVGNSSYEHPAGSDDPSWYVPEGFSGRLYIRNPIVMAKCTANAVTYLQLQITSGYTATSDDTYKPQVFDLTQMFGSDIADGIYAMEQAEAGSGVAFFKTLFAPEDYYEYNAGEDMIITLRKKAE